MPPLITKSECNGCGICVFQCGAFCLYIDVNTNKSALKDVEDCANCFQCEAKCPREAIKIVYRKTTGVKK